MSHSVQKKTTAEFPKLNSARPIELVSDFFQKEIYKLFQILEKKFAHR